MSHLNQLLHAQQRRTQFRMYKELQERHDLLLSTWKETVHDNKQMQFRIEELEQKLADLDAINKPDGVCSYHQECEAFFKTLTIEQRFLPPPPPSLINAIVDSLLS